MFKRKRRNTKITPWLLSTEKEVVAEKPLLKMRVMRLHTLFKLYGSQRHPRLDIFESLEERLELIEWRFVPPKAATIFISHEWTGRTLPDAAAMARDSSNPPLLVRSERGTPMWTSPLEILKLSIGMADFTCCQRNHVATTETQKVMGEGKMKKIPCDKPIVGGILEQLIDAKIDDLFDVEGDMVMGRLHRCFKHWWMRGLKSKANVAEDENGAGAVDIFKKNLRWAGDESWFDRGGMGLMMYAVTGDEFNVVCELLQIFRRDFKDENYQRHVESRVRDKGYPVLGIPGGTTTLMAAMMTASSEVVSTLLEYGASVERIDTIGTDAFMYAASYGRSENVTCWLERFKLFNLNRRDRLFGACALSHAIFFGANKLKTVQILLDAGARLDFRTYSGASALTNAAENEDSDPDVVSLLLQELKQRHSAESFKSIVNYRRRAVDLKWKTIRLLARVSYRLGAVPSSSLLYLFAIGSGSTPLNHATYRGDVEIVEILLENGADPYVENGLGMNAFEICKKFGPYPSVMKLLQKKSKEN